MPGGMPFPSMTGVLPAKDGRRLRPVSPDLAAFAAKVRQTNVFLSEVC